MQAAEQDYEGVNSRRHVDGVLYALPEDKQEIDRLDLQHYILRYALEGNYLAPLENPTRLLDVGCGTGRWAMEMAQAFPQAEVVGIDLKLPEAGTSPFPPNCHFQEGNTLHGLPFEDSSFDFVHQRFLLFAVPASLWFSRTQELVRVTRLHGWLELTEMNPFLLHMGPETGRMIDLVVQAAQQQGLDIAISQNIEGLLQGAGLAQVQKRTQLIPCGSWGGRLGALALTDILAIAQAMKGPVVAQTQTTPEEYDALTAQMKQEVEQYHTAISFHIAYGQRCPSM